MALELNSSTTEEIPNDAIATQKKRIPLSSPAYTVTLCSRDVTYSSFNMVDTRAKLYS